MSLLSESMTACVIMDKTTEADGYGGVVTTWKDGASINAAIVLNSSMTALQAQKLGVTSVYTITTEKSVVLRFNDVVKRVSDGLLLRVTSNGDDNKTPASANLNMRQVTAEVWSDGQVPSTT